MPITTREQAHALAEIIHQLHPTWTPKGILNTLWKHRENPAPYASIVQAAITQAKNPNTQTPAAIFFEGSHWPPEAKPHLPPPNPCPDHPEHTATNCLACWADHKTGIRPRHLIGKHHEPPMT